MIAISTEDQYLNEHLDSIFDASQSENSFANDIPYSSTGKGKVKKMAHQQIEAWYFEILL